MFSDIEFTDFMLRLEDPNVWDGITVKELNQAFEYVCNNYDDLEDPDSIYNTIYQVRGIK